jgi:hypothetical protein
MLLATMVRFITVLFAAGVVASCRPAVLTQQVEARRIAADLHLQFTKATEAANRAVMADTDEASASAADQAREALRAVERDVEQLYPILKSLGYADELTFLDAFNQQLAEYRALDEEILPLAVENTNLKAQRLSFGAAREAADAFRASVEAAAKASTSKECCADALAARAGAALLEIQVLHAPHIAEAEDAAMTRMEQRMTALEVTAQKALDELKGQLGASGGPQLAAASAALEHFKGSHREIITLSRRNSDVRSLALSLGRKRMVAAVADDQLRALEDALGKHAFTATR